MEPPPFRQLVSDHFSDRRPVGATIGLHGRTGVDVEGVIGVDGDAARIKPLRTPGWGRSVLAYGPFDREPGLVASFLLTNGHNASENADCWPTVTNFLAQTIRGSQIDSPLRRVGSMVRFASRDPLWRRIATVRGNRRAFHAGTGSTENLSVGLFGEMAPTSATGGGHGFVVQSAGPQNGTLRMSLGELRSGPSIVEPLWNVPVQYVVAAREQGTMLYCAALGATSGLAEPGQLRPMALDTRDGPRVLWAGLNQHVLGQVGWGIDTRVHAVDVAVLPAWASWCGTAQAADRLRVPADVAERGGPWVTTGHFAALTPAEPTGLLHVWTDSDVDLILRADPDALTAMRIRVGATTVSVQWLTADNVELVAEADLPAPLSSPAPRSVQVSDDGRRIGVIIDGQLVLEAVSDRGAANTGVGLGRNSLRARPTVHVWDFEAHPRLIPCPTELAGAWPTFRLGRSVVLDSSFAKTISAVRPDIGGYVASTGQVWRHRCGERFVLGPDGATVQPTERPALTKVGRLTAPSGVRSEYTIPWPPGALADIEVEIRQPGTAQHQGHNGRGGLSFWQDDDNALLVNLYLNDEYDGSSISCFFRVNGHEEVYDAVWNNVGRRVTWGGTNRLRVSFDGDTWVALLDDELVLHRRLRDVYPDIQPFQVRRVGIMTNWEFGNDSGSTFSRVIGRR